MIDVGKELIEKDTGSGGGKKEKRRFFHFNTKDAGNEEPSEPIIKAMEPQPRAVCGTRLQRRDVLCRS